MPIYAAFTVAVAFFFFQINYYQYYHYSGGPIRGHLKGDIWKRDFAVNFELDLSILTALSKAVQQGKCRLDGERAPSRQGNMH